MVTEEKFIEGYLKYWKIFKIRWGVGEAPFNTRIQLRVQRSSPTLFLAILAQRATLCVECYRKFDLPLHEYR